MVIDNLINELRKVQSLKADDLIERRPFACPNPNFLALNDSDEYFDESLNTFFSETKLVDYMKYYKMKIFGKNADIQTNGKTLKMQFSNDAETNGIKRHSEHTLECTLPDDADVSKMTAVDKGGFVELVIPKTMPQPTETEYRKINIKR